MEPVVVVNVDIDELKKEIDAVNISDIPTGEKEGLHHFLGAMLDGLTENTGCLVLEQKVYLAILKEENDRK